MNCTCPDWKPNIEIINGPYILQQIRQPGSVRPCKQFVFCPWCGRKLIDEDMPKSGCQKCGKPTFGPICAECKGEPQRR
jgi:hypothetical protein